MTDRARSSRRRTTGLRQRLVQWVVPVSMVLAFLVIAPPPPAFAVSTFTVNVITDTHDLSTLDGVCSDAAGKCSLRAAIEQANSRVSLGTDTIRFCIGGGLQTITPTLGAFPTITGALVMDAITLPLHCLAPGQKIELNGASAGAGASGLTITGGPSTVKGLTINRFSANGISLSTGGGNVITGNLIGTDSNGEGTVSGNGQDGVLISSGSSSNRIGGVSVSERNVISHNSLNGVNVSGGTGNLIEGNYIGTDATGTAGLGNTLDGVRIFTNSNTVGGTATGASNVISGNGNGINGRGVSISGSATGNLIQGNYIGTNAAGTAAIANNLEGVHISSPSNTVGGTVAGARNVISGNGGNGVAVFGTGNLIQGNYIGTNAAGTAAIANFFKGVLISGSSITVGGTASGAGNVISGNGWFGVEVSLFGNGNQIQGNYIGTDATGTAALGNALGGVNIRDSSNNTVGGTASGASNVISGNGGFGLAVMFANGNLIQGNYIGTDATGTAALGNALGGVISDSSNATTVGGTVSGARNVISGNGGLGVKVSFGKAILIQGNYIGTDATGTAALGNTVDGVFIGNSSSTVGGMAPGARNIISGNGANGVEILGSGATGNLVQGNYIGTDATGTAGLGNTADGVHIAGGSGNLIGGGDPGAVNTIAFNGGIGVSVLSGTGNHVSENSIFSNAALGIDLGADGVTPNDPGDGDTGPNQLQNVPALTAAASANGLTTIVGTLDSTPNTLFTLEFFSSPSCDPSSKGEGQTFLGSSPVSTDGAGQASFSPALPMDSAPGNVITATATDPSGNTSEFSACQTVHVASADLSITKSDIPDPVTAGANLTYTLTVTDQGPDLANQAVVTDTLGPTEKLVSATPGQGSCAGTSIVTCDLGQMASSQVVTITIVVVPVAPGTVTNTASVTAHEPDPTTGNNTTSATTTVAPAPNTSYVSVTDSGFSPSTVTLKKQGQTVQWNFFGPAQHSATDLSGMGLFDSGLRSPVDFFQFTFVGAGTYAVSDSGSTNTGVIKVPLKAKPKSGGTTTIFTITWATSVPLGFDFDVQIKRPGSAQFVDWKPDTVAKSAKFTPDAGAGTYQFRARIEKGATGPASGYSSPVSITVA